MGFLIAILFGGLIGYVASIIAGRNSSLGIFGNIVVGFLGAVLGNLLLSPIFGEETTLSDPSWPGFFLGVAGAVILLFVVNLFTRRSVR